MSSSLTEDDVLIPSAQRTVTFPFPESEISSPLRHIPFVKLHSNAGPSQWSKLNVFSCEVCNVIWPGKCSSCKTLLCGTDRYYEVANNCGIFPFPRKWRWKHEKFRFYKYRFIAGMITTELICFCTSVAIVVLSFVFTQLSFHCEMLLRWHKIVHSSTTSRLQSFFCVVCWLYVYCILRLSTTLKGFYFCVCSPFFFKLESLSQCFPYNNFCISTQIQLPI